MTKLFLALCSSIFLFSACTTTGVEPRLDKSNAVVPKITPRPAPTTPPKNLKLHALVIGNSDYKQFPLKNTTADAKAIANKFRSLGFNVTELHNLSRKQFKEESIAFAELARDSDVTLFYYAGHGIQVNGTNYLMPIDTDFGGTIESAINDGINLNALLKFNIPGATRIVFLDACRSNPIKSARSKDGYEGLAPMNVAPGTLISFATRGGGVALEGPPGTHSPYTRALIQYLGVNKDVTLMLRDVRNRVIAITRNKQVPWEYGALRGGQIVISKLSGQ